jgi:predicted nucleic acid-binding protein
LPAQEGTQEETWVSNGEWFLGGVSLAEMLEMTEVKARHKGDETALSDLMAEIELPRALATVHRQMDIQAETDGMEGKKGPAFLTLKPVSDEDLLVAHQATMKLIPLVQVLYSTLLYCALLYSSVIYFYCTLLYYTLLYSSVH